MRDWMSPSLFPLLGLLALAPPAWGRSLKQAAEAIPDPHTVDGGWVLDQAGLLGDNKAEINATISALERDTSAEIGVAVLASIGDEVPKDFATALFEHWGLGKAGQDNGVLVLHVVDQRQVEIETGYGLEANLTDARCAAILDQVTIPAFRQGDFGLGHYRTVQVLGQAIRQPGLPVSDLVGSLGQPSATTSAVPTIPLPLHKEPVALNSRAAANFFDLLLGLMAAAATLGITFLLGLAALIWGRLGDPHRPWKVHRILRFAEYPVLMGGAGYWLAQTGVSTTWGLALPPMGIGLAVWGWRSLVSSLLRRQRRTCPQCHAKATRLSEEQEDQYLEAGQEAEERVKSVDYDVWECECGWHRVDAYTWMSRYSRCPACSYRTLHCTGSTVIQAATYSSSGRRQVTHDCAHCNHHQVTYHTIPRKTRTQSSSSGGSRSSSGSSSRSSFGGGRSGGGGAGRRY